MATTFRPYEPDDAAAGALREWLPEGHFAHVSDLVDGLDLTAFYAPKAMADARYEPPRCCCSIVLAGEGSRTFLPTALCEFRRRHLEEGLFVGVVRVARELARFGMSLQHALRMPRKVEARAAR